MSIFSIFRFHGGVHPHEHKLATDQVGIQPVAMPQRLILPLRQHAGNLAKPVVAVGDYVQKGQTLARGEGYVSAAVHAPTSGTVIAIDEQLIPHASGLQETCLTLQADGHDTWGERVRFDYAGSSLEAVRQYLSDMGVVGLGGAAFPTHAKLGAKPLETLVINGAECEPYISCDDGLMRDRADGVIRGIAILCDLMKPQRCLIGIETNKPEAVAAMRAAIDRQQAAMEVVVIPTLYPSGGARQLIYALTGREVPGNGRAMDIGAQCFNVATAYVVHRAIDHGEPVISRIVTVTGRVARAGNYEVPLGMRLDELIAFAGGELSGTCGYLMGGPLMGMRLATLEVPVVKSSNCIIAAEQDILEPEAPVMPCIRCVRCADVCPVILQPQDLYWFAKSKNLEKARDYHLFDCIECGCCSYVCPSNIPLVEYYRFAKDEIAAQDQAKQAADAARIRNESRLARLAREKTERAAKHAQRHAAAPVPDAEKQALIAAALARAEAQKLSTQGVKPVDETMESPS